MPEQNENQGHTRKAYNGLAEAYDYFNKFLFENKLPSCLITVQRKKNCYGYFSRDRFTLGGGEVHTDEIALNPALFEGRSNEEILSTLVHEMVHLWQYHTGEPGKGGYHNKEWAIAMHKIGLHPSNTGKLGGKETGPQMTHYIEDKGPFIIVCKEFLLKSPLVFYSDVRTNKSQGVAKVKRDSKTKYSCEMCGINAWAKPSTVLVCGICRGEMEPETQITELAA